MIEKVQKPVQDNKKDAPTKHTVDNSASDFVNADFRTEVVSLKSMEAFADDSRSGLRITKQESLAETSNQSRRTTQLQTMADASSSARKIAQLQAMSNNSPTQQFSQQNPVQLKGNNTGLPDNLKSGIENLSGVSMDRVKVHKNSDKPAQLNAHAYAQGTDIHLGAGQEKHLPHEAWHVVQQSQGRVQPTTQMAGVNINDNSGLEKEADVMGSKALQMKAYNTPTTNIPTIKGSNDKKDSGIAQLSSTADNYLIGSPTYNSSIHDQKKIIQRAEGDDVVADDSANSAPAPVPDEVSDEIAVHVLAKSGVIPEEDIASNSEVPSPEVSSEEDQGDAAASSETEEAPELRDTGGGDIESQALPVEATRTLRSIDIIDDHIQDKSPDQEVSDKVLPAQQAGAKVAKSNNEETGRVQADSLLVRTKSMVMAVEAKKKKEEEAPAIELPASEIDSSGDEDLQESQEFENAVAADISPKDEALLKDAEAPTVDSIIGEYASDLLRIKGIADSKNEININDLKIIQLSSEKIQSQLVTKFMITNLFTIIDKISADITDGSIDIVYYDADDNRIVMNKEGEIISSLVGAVNDVSNIASQVGWNGGENSGVSNLGTNPLYKTLIDWQAGLSDADMLLLSGVSDTSGAAAGLAGTFFKFKKLREQLSPENWAKKNKLEKAQLVAEITGTFTQGLSGIGKGTAGVMDSLGTWQETNATSVFSGEALMSSSGQMSGTSSIKYVGDIAGVAAGGLDFVASSFSAINDFKKWKAKNKKDWYNPYKHKEGYSKSLLTAAKLTQSAAGVARDAYRVALHTGAVSAAQELTTTAAATGASVAVGGLTAIRAAYLLRKYKGRKHKLGVEKEKLDPAVEGNVEKQIVMTDLESVLQKKINRAYVNLAGSALEITAGALALSGFGSIVGIGLAALLGASKLVYAAGKGFRQWRRDVQARKRLETYENWKERQEAKVALNGGGVKRSLTLATTMKSGYAKKQSTAGETYAEWKARHAGSRFLIKTTSNWDKATGAKELKYVEIAQAIKKYNDRTLYESLGLEQEINGQKDHDQLVIEKLKSRA